MDERELHYAQLSEERLRKKVEEMKINLENQEGTFDPKTLRFEPSSQNDEEEENKSSKNTKIETPLLKLSVRGVCNRIDELMTEYLEKESEISDEERPKFGNLAQSDEEAARKILECLIETESLKPIHLKVLLEDNTTHLPCNENSYYTPFTVETLKVISRRCTKFEELHFHSDVRTPIPRPWEQKQTKPNYLESSLDDSLLCLTTSVTVLNFTDAGIDGPTLRIICNCFKSLKVLNLHQALMETMNFEILVDPDCVIKNTVENLRVDNTSIPTAIIGRCLEQYKNLKYFRSDATITALLFLEKVKVKIPKPLKISILKQKFNTYRCDIPDSELVDEVVNVVRNVPNVDHLIFTTIQKLAIKFVNEIITTCMMMITKLELSCFETIDYYEFSELKPVFEDERLCDNLTSLTLECYYQVDVFYLIERCEKLEELTLINNTYKKCNKNYWMPLQKLRELKIIYLSEVANDFKRIHPYQYYMDIDTFCATMSSRILQKVVVVNQRFFEIALERSLDSGFLGKLQELCFFSCEVRLEVLMKIFEMGASLKKVEYSNDSVHRGATEKLFELLVDNYYEASVLPRDDLPHWLHWSLVCIKLFKKNKKIKP